MPLKLDENPNFMPMIGDANFKLKEQALNTVTKLNWESPDALMGKTPSSEEIELQKFTKDISNSREDDTIDSLEENGERENSKINLLEYNRFSMIDDENELDIPNDDFNKNSENSGQAKTVKTAALNTVLSFCKTKVLSAPNITENDHIYLDCSRRITKKCNIEKDNSCKQNERIIGHKPDSNISDEKQILISAPKVNSSENKSDSENKEINRKAEKITHLYGETHVCKEEFFQLTEDYHSLNNKSSNVGIKNKMANTDKLDKNISPESLKEETVTHDGKPKLLRDEEEWNIDSLVFYEDLYPQKSKNILFHFPKARETFETIRSQALRSFRSLTSEFQRINKRLNSKDQEFNKQNCILGKMNQEMGDENITEECTHTEVRENTGSVTLDDNTATKVRNLKPCSSSKSIPKKISTPNWDDLHFLGESFPERKNLSSTIMDFGRNARTTVRHWYSTRKKTTVN